MNDFLALLDRFVIEAALGLALLALAYRSRRIKSQDPNWGKAIELDAAGDYDGAITQFKAMAERASSHTRKAVMWVNIALLELKRERSKEALAAFDNAIEAEASSKSHFGLESKAAYLATQGQDAGASSIYRQLLNRPDLTSEERARFEANIEKLTLISCKG